MKQADIIIKQVYKNSNGFPVIVESLEPARIKGMHARFIVRNLVTGRIARRTAAGLHPMPINSTLFGSNPVDLKDGTFYPDAYTYRKAYNR